MSDYEKTGTTRTEPKRADAANSEVSCEETKLFPDVPAPRYFGEGSYTSGGPVSEGNYALPDPNPRGGYGCFDDAGGIGSTELLGEHGERDKHGEHK